MEWFHASNTAMVFNERLKAKQCDRPMDSSGTFLNAAFPHQNCIYTFFMPISAYRLLWSYVFQSGRVQVDFITVNSRLPCQCPVCHAIKNCQPEILSANASEAQVISFCIIIVWQCHSCSPAYGWGRNPLLILPRCDFKTTVSIPSIMDNAFKHDHLISYSHCGLVILEYT